MYTKCTCPQHLGEWGIDDQSLVLLNNVVLPLNEQTEGCLTQELQTTQVCNLSREVKRPPKEVTVRKKIEIQNQSGAEAQQEGANPQPAAARTLEEDGCHLTTFCWYMCCALSSFRWSH
ncbi:hypothetical protein Y1Q_0013995 [Alligator mississippiensis]|uniref:Uncharacterized protein n=1 Tax=Alligator mississippiensis TaxID=8496 RepID=A0A151PDM8_ALLMI|nr:hypothetical protein Y1Q_0013995 [Alligator mississippiensis]